jgi:hypothetical protein
MRTQDTFPGDHDKVFTQEPEQGPTYDVSIQSTRRKALCCHLHGTTIWAGFGAFRATAPPEPSVRNQIRT